MAMTMRQTNVARFQTASRVMHSFIFGFRDETPGNEPELTTQS